MTFKNKKNIQSIAKPFRHKLIKRNRPYKANFYQNGVYKKHHVKISKMTIYSNCTHRSIVTVNKTQ